MNPPDRAAGAEDAVARARNLAVTLLSPSLLEAIPDAIIAVNQQGIILQANSQTEVMFGYTRDELIGQRIETLVPDRFREQHRQHRDHFAEQPRARRMGSGLDLRGQRRDGSEFPVEISLSPISTDDGIVVLSAIRDVSDRVRIEKELRRAHQELSDRKDRQLWEHQHRLSLIVDSSQDAIIGKNLDGIIAHWNKGAEHIYGYEAEEAIGRPITLLASDDHKDEIPKILESIRNGQHVEHFETVRVTKDGRHVNVSISISPIHNEAGEIVGASTIARNITSQKKAEDLLRQSQKMEAIGRLAGGIAHDFNNILGIITMSAELLRDHITSEDLPKELIGHIRDASKRGSALTKQLLGFSRKQPLQPKLLDLNERLKDVCKLLRPLMGDDVKIQLLPRSELAFVRADPSQLDQIMLNLAVNSRDAMPRGGKFIIETATVEFDDDIVRQHPPMKTGRYVMLAVSDNGAGMPEEIRSRIFEPFFTTKDVGKGTGLGLATVYGIVQQSGGHIWVYSEPDRGTTFKIYLPSANGETGLHVEGEEETALRRGEGTTILLVEDDPAIRGLSRRMLEAQGYSVIEAADGKSALQQAQSHPGHIDLVLTDIVMQGISGPELVLRIMDSHPETRFLYMSGYTGELVIDHGLGEGIALLEKPFSRQSLLSSVQAALQ
jgi:two-component system cell cycle sensor histidine kinase/response regulator CckA